MSLYAERILKIGTENAFKIGWHIAKLEQTGKKVIKLNLGEPDFNIPDAIKEEIKHQLNRNNTHYCDPKGLLSLRTAIAAQIFETRGLEVSPEQVVVFPGAKPAIGFSQEVYCNPGDEIIYPSPGFPIYESFAQYLSCIPKPLKLREETGFTFSAEALKALITPKTKLIYLNFPSNPTGGVANQEALQNIAQVILENCNDNVRVYSDEIYENIIFDGQKHLSIASLPDMAKRTIISSGFSKTYAWTGGRVGYAIFPTFEEADIFKNLNINYFSCVPPYNQEAARVGLEHPESKQLIQKMVSIFEQRRNEMVDALNKLKGVRIQKPKGAFYVFPNIEAACEDLGALEAFSRLPKNLQENTSPTTLFQLFALYYHHVAFLDRRSFCKIGAEDQHFIRLSAASESTVLKEGIQRLEAALLDRAGFAKFMAAQNPLF